MKNLSNAPINVLQGVGPARAKAYSRLGVDTVSDLLYHFPRAYENRGDIKLLDKWSFLENEHDCVWTLSPRVQNVAQIFYGSIV